MRFWLLLSLFWRMLGRMAEMLIVTIEVNAPSSMAQAVKEQLAMLVERYGDTRVVKVEGKDGT